MSDRRVLIGMPGYSNLTGDASRGYWRATRLPDSQVIYKYNHGSLLAANFNGLWTHALNVVHRGGRLDYFAMQHADVGPEDWWLDTLIDELEARDLDVLGVVVPIKDGHGTTSLALGRPDGDPWRPLCRLTMAEVYRLPETFTSEDLGHPILLNTGLWVCRFDLEWARLVHFTINDRIVFDQKADCYRAQCEPEDWCFSRLLHELGAPGSPTDGCRPLRIGATRKVTLNHRGEVDFPNTHAWGEAYDSAWVDSSVVPDDLPGFVFPSDVEGWLRPEEGRELARLAKGKRVLEVGSYCGLSTICLAQTADHVVSVDPHDGRGTPDPQDTLPKLVANLERYGVADKVEGIIDTFTPWENTRRVFDLVFIDGAHDYESVFNDVTNALDVLAPGGLIAFHDYRTSPGQFDGRWDPGVTRAVNELLDSGGELLSRCATVAVVRPPALVPSTLEV